MKGTGSGDVSLMFRGFVAAGFVGVKLEWVFYDMVSLRTATGLNYSIPNQGEEPAFSVSGVCATELH